MILHLICIFVLFIILVILCYNTYESFNSDFPQKNFSPNTDKPLPTALDGSTYMSPDSSGKCPDGFERNMKDDNSLCHPECKFGKFYKANNKVYGCIELNKKFPQEDYANGTFPYAEDKKTSIVSPTADGTCPSNFELDIKSGLCYTKCKDNSTFFGEMGCLILNTKFSQADYDGSDNPYLLAQDQKTKIISPTSSAICPSNFMLDYTSGLCHTECPERTKFNGTVSGQTVVGCQ